MSSPPVFGSLHLHENGEDGGGWGAGAQIEQPVKLTRQAGASQGKGADQVHVGTKLSLLHNFLNKAFKKLNQIGM